MFAPLATGRGTLSRSCRSALGRLLPRSTTPEADCTLSAYRLDFLDERRVRYSCEFLAETDAWAEWQAQLRRRSLRMELWCGTMLVRSWDWLAVVPPFP
jgi:hypothetical protein